MAEKVQRSGSVLADPLFRLLWVGTGLASVAEQLFIVCLTLLVLDVAGAGAALGGVLAVAAVPRAVLLPFGGLLADRVDPARVVVVTTVARTVVLAGIAALVLLGTPNIAVVAGLAGLLGVLDALFYPASMALLPRVVPPASLPRANALVQGAESAGDLLGPVVAAALVAFAGAGAGLGTVSGLYALAAVVLAVVARRLGRLAGTPSASAPTDIGAVPVGPAPRDGLREGFRFAWGEPLVRTSLLVLAGLNVAVVGPILVGGAVLAEQRLGSPAALGLVFAGFGIGSLLGLVTAGACTARRRGLVLVGCTAVIGIGTAGFGVVGSLLPAMATAAVVGAGSGYLGVALVAWLQQWVPEHVRGRVMSLVVLAVVALDPLSYALAGALLPAGLPVLFAVSGALVLALAALAALTPSVRSMR